MKLPIEEPTTADFEALGRFIACCSAIEGALHFVLHNWLEIDERIQRRLVGEPRSGDLIDLVKFAYQHSKVRHSQKSAEIVVRLDWVYSQCDYLNQVRSIVAHKSVYSDGAALRFHNEATAKGQSALSNYLVTARQLMAASMHALAIAGLLRQAATTAKIRPERFLAACDELQASARRSGLPAHPSTMRLATAPKPTRQPRSPPGKSKRSQP